MGWTRHLACSRQFILSTSFPRLFLIKCVQALLVKTGAGRDLVPLLDDTVELVLEALDEQLSDEFVHAYLRVLLSVVRAIAPEHSVVKSDTGSVETPKCFSANAIHDRLKTAISQFEREEALEKELVNFEDGLDDETLLRSPHEIVEEQAPPEQPEQSEEEVDTTTDAEKTTVRILERVQHFLESPSPLRRHLVLELFHDGLSVLANNEKQLLPLVAKLWEPLKPRFMDAHNAVLGKALEIAELMVALCPQFISRRLQRELWPCLRFILRQQQQRSQVDSHSSSSSSTLLRRTLSFLCSVLQSSSMQIVPEVADVCWCFLSNQQQPEVRMAAELVFRRIATLDGDKVWWSLLRACGSDRYKCAPPHCLPVQALREPDPVQRRMAATCQDRVSVLLHLLDNAPEAAIDDYLPSLHKE